MFKMITFFFTLFNAAFLAASTIGEAELLDRMERQGKDAVQMSQIAELKSQNDKVKKLARSIIAFHQRNQKKITLYQYRWYSKIKVPTRQIASLDTSGFADLSGSEFDRAYLKAMAEHNKKGIEAMGLMMPNVDKRAVHHLAIKTVKRMGNDLTRMERMTSALD